jgi:FMN phosphatase YigB (HAD superfamily)
MYRPSKTVLITDLDNTLFDWVGLWYACFGAMLEKLVEKSGLPESKLKEEIRVVHQKHGTSEYSFLLEEMPSLKEMAGDSPVVDLFHEAIQIYRERRRSNLKLYPTVAETLLRIKGTGALVVGYTESMAFYSNYRVRRLGLDGVLDFVFSPADHEIPHGLIPEDIRKYPAEKYEFKRTKHRHTPAGELKPSKSVLQSIIQDIGATPDHCVYVGDSLMKDITMAQDAGVADVWAKYGLSQETRGYQLLREVTHWMDADVAREKKISQRDVCPGVILENSISEIQNYFKFGDGKAFYVLENSSRLNADEQKNIIDIWKEVVDVQKHFNDISLRIRGLFITLILALFAATGFLLEKPLRLTFGYFTFKYSTFVPLLGVIGTWLFYFIDRHWYHRLLVGSVNQALTIERKYQWLMPDLALSKAIGEASPIRLKSWPAKALAWFIVCDQSYRSKGELHSNGKIELFYKPIIYIFVALFVVLVLSGGVKYKEISLFQILITRTSSKTPVGSPQVTNGSIERDRIDRQMTEGHDGSSKRSPD